MDENTQVLTWTEVRGATNYRVRILCGTDNLTDAWYDIGNITTLDLRFRSALTGGIVVYVIPESLDAISPLPSRFVWNRQTVATPQGVHYHAGSIAWNAVYGATSYEIELGPIGDTNIFSSDVPYFPITLTPAVIYTFRVRTIGAGNNNYSLWSASQTITNDMGELTFENNRLMWDLVAGVDGFQVRIDGGTPFVVMPTAHNVVDGVVRHEIVFDRAGLITLEVRFFIGGVVQPDWTAIQVQTYTVTFDTQFEMNNFTQYYAIGDTVRLPAIIRDGYVFMNWTSAPGGDGIAFDNTINRPIVSGATTLFAHWVANEYLVILYGGFNDADGNQIQYEEIEFGTSFELPVPINPNQNGRIFIGWFAGEADVLEGTRITNELGQGIGYWNIAGTITLYPVFEDVLSFIRMDEGYAVSRNFERPELILLIANLSIPYMYTGRRVTHITVGAFADLLTLKTVRIPATIEFIQSGAFAGTANVEHFEVYDPVSIIHTDIRYESQDGMVFRHRMQGGVSIGMEIALFPLGVSGDVVLPAGTLAIPEGVFRNATELTSIFIPASVTYIGNHAFRNTFNMSTITIAPNSNLERIGNYAFVNSGITSFHVPRSVRDTGGNYPFDIEARPGIGAYAFRSASQLQTFTFELGGTYPLSFSNANTIRGVFSAYYWTIFVAGEGNIMPHRPNNVTHIHIPNRVTHINRRLFDGQVNLQTLTFEEGGTIPLVFAMDGPNRTGAGSASVLEGTSIRNIIIPARTQNTIHQFTRIGVPQTEYVALGIGIAAFASTALNSLQFAGGGTNPLSIGRRAFASTAITSLTIPARVQDFHIYEDVGGTLTRTAYIHRVGRHGTTPIFAFGIGNAAFSNNLSLNSLIITDGMQPLTIDETAFANLVNLPSVIIPTRVIRINSRAFYFSTRALGDSSSLVSFTFAPDRTEDLILHPGSQGIWREANNITSINLIQRVVIATRTALTTERFTPVELFRNMRGLESITVAEGHDQFINRDGMLLNHGGYRLYFFPQGKILGGDLVIPSGIREINRYTFRHMDDILTVTIPYGVTYIGERAFAGEHWHGASAGPVMRIHTITFAGRPNDGYAPEAGLIIGTRAFENNLYLKNLNFMPRSNVTTIGVEAFWISSLFSVPYTNLEEINLPGTLTLLNTRAFARQASLTDVNFTAGRSLRLGNEPFIGTNVSILTLPAHFTMEDVTWTLRQVMTGVTQILICDENPYFMTYEGVLYNRVRATVFCDSENKYIYVTENGEYVYIPTIVMLIPDGLINFILPSTITTIPNNLFQNNTTIQSIIIPHTVATIGTSAFRNSAIQTVNFLPAPSGINPIPLVINANAFHDAGNLQNFQLPLRTTTIGADAFRGASGITTVSLNRNLMTIGARAFLDTDLTEVSFDGGIAESVLSVIGAEAFRNTNLTTFTMPDSVRSIGANAFNNSGAHTIHLPNNPNFTVITPSAFAGSNITTMYIPGYVRVISNQAFENALQLHTVTFGANTQMQRFGAIAGAPAGGGYTVAQNAERQNWNWGAVPTASTATQGAFRNTPMLTTMGIAGSIVNGTVSLPHGLTWIPVSTFRESGAINVVVPNTVTHFGTTNLNNTTALASGGVFFNSSVQTVLFAEGNDAVALNMAIPTAAAQDGVFMGALQLRTVSLPYRLTNASTFPRNGFRNTPMLETVRFPDRFPGSGITLGEQAFMQSGIMYMGVGDGEFDGLIIPEGVNTLGIEAFRGAERIQRIDLPASLTAVLGSAGNGGDAANFGLNNNGHPFVATPALHTLNIASGNTSFRVIDGAGSGIIRNSDNRVVAWPAARVQQTVTIPYSVAAVGNRAFYRAAGISYVEFAPAIGSSVPLNINTHAFFASSIIEIDLPARLAGGNVVGVGIGERAFQNTASLKTVRIALTATFTHLRPNAFLNSNVQTVVLSNHITHIMTDAFRGSNIEGIILPSSLVEIGEGAFRYSALDEIIIPNSVNIINGDAFRGTNYLTDVYFASGLNNNRLIFNAGNVFNGAVALESITLPTDRDVNFTNATGTPQTQLFLDTHSLTSIYIPRSVTIIPNSTFQRSGLQSIEFGHDSLLLSIGTSAFAGTRLTTIEIPGRLAVIGGAPVLNNEVITNPGVANINALDISTLEYIAVHENNVTFASVNGVLYNSTLTTLFRFPSRHSSLFEEIDGIMVNTGRFTIHPGTQIIAANAFDENVGNAGIGGSLHNARLDPNLMEIARPGNRYLRHLTIPGTVTAIGNRAFAGTFALETVTFLPGTEPLHFAAAASNTPSQGVFALSGIKNFTFPARTVIGTDTANSALGMFRATPRLDTISFEPGASLTRIPNHFARDSGLISIDIPRGVTHIGQQAFANTECLVSVSLPSSLTHMEADSFAINFNNERGFNPDLIVADERLSEITIPAGVIHMGNNVFLNRSELAVVNFLGDIPAVFGTGVFRGTPVPVAIVGSAATIAAYAFAGGTHGNDVTPTFTSFIAPSHITGVGIGAFANNHYIEEVILPIGVSTLGGGTGDVTGVFQNASSLYRVEIYGNITVLSTRIFAEARNLTHLVLPGTITTVARDAFRNAGSLTSLEFTDAFSTIGDIGRNPFRGMSSLEYFYVPETNIHFETIDGVLYRLNDDGIAYRLVAFPGAKIPNYGEVDEGVFIVPDTVTHISAFAFDGAVGITEVVLPSQLGFVTNENSTAAANIGGYMFANSSLERIELPEGMTTIPHGMFFNTKLESIIIPGSVTMINAGAFAATPYLRDVIFAEGTGNLTLEAGGTSVNFDIIFLVTNHIGTELSNAFLPGVFAKTGLRAITFPDRLMSIPGRLFEGSEYLETVIIPSLRGTSAVHRILGHSQSANGLGANAGWAFEGTRALINFVIPESINNIAGNGFRNSGMTGLIITSNITLMGVSVFYGWYDTQTVIMQGIYEPPVGWNIAWDDGSYADFVWAIQPPDKD